MKIKITILAMTILVKSEGYYCPYETLGATESNDLLYDYYNTDDNGDSWVRLNETGWMTRTDYCNAKGDISLHFDAGKIKCEDSQGTCLWIDEKCIANTFKSPDCFELCEAVINNNGLQCLGNCPGGPVSRETLYDICSDTFTTNLPIITTTLPITITTTLPITTTTKSPITTTTKSTTLYLTTTIGKLPKKTPC